MEAIMCKLFKLKLCRRCRRFLQQPVRNLLLGADLCNNNAKLVI